MKRSVMAVAVIALVLILAMPIALYQIPSVQAQSDLEKHIIAGVPFVGHAVPVGCGMYSSQMVFEYFGINITIPEQIYYMGWSSSFGYLTDYYLPTEVSSTEDYNFLSDLYGFKVIFRVPDVGEPYTSLNETEWNSYWDVVKEYIAQDMPVITNVDPHSLPYYKEVLNITGEEAGVHMIVIVGFDEDEELVYYNDPVSTLFPEVENASYVSVSISDFKNAVNRTQYKKGLVWTYQKVGEPMSLEERLELAHERNKQRIKGNSSAYSLDLLKGMEVKLGIDGLRAYRDNITEAWNGWKNENETSIKNTNNGYVNPQILTFGWLGYANEKSAAYLEEVGGGGAERYVQFGKGCEKIFKKYRDIYQALDTGKIDDETIRQVNTNLEHIKEELDVLIALWQNEA